VHLLKLSISTLLAATVLSAGCQSTASPPAGLSQAPTTCNAEAVRNLIGKTATTALLEEAKKRSGASTARILGPDDIVTLEYDSRRLNINTGADMTIERISCG
jgi:hypothetical protein